jgi:hypothetical protein
MRDLLLVAMLASTGCASVSDDARPLRIALGESPIATSVLVPAGLQTAGRELR